MRPISRALGVLALCLSSSGLVAQRWFDSPLVLRPSTSVLAVGDVESDGDQDLLTFESTGIVVRKNDGNADFTDEAFTPFPAGLMLGDADPVLLDVDLDTRLDLILPTASGFVTAFGVGDGTFGTLVNTALTTGQATRIVPGDYDGNGVVDLAIASGSNPVEVTWWSWDGTQWNGTAPVGIVELLTTASLTVGDFDDDGFDDAAVSTFSAGTFATVLSIGGVPSTVTTFAPAVIGSETLQLAAGDLDGDGDDDLLAVRAQNDEVEFYPFQQQGGALLAMPTTLDDSVNNLGITFGILGMKLGDWDADGDLDVANQIPFQVFGLGTLQATLFENVGGFAFGARITNPVPRVGKLAGIVDVDGDGHLDLCCAGSITFGDGTLTPALGSDAPTSVSGGRLDDLEGDGDLDVRNGTARARNDGTGAFTSEFDVLPSLPGNFAYRGSFLSGDFVGSDGYVDYLVELWEVVGTVFEPDIFIEMRILQGLPDGSFVDLGVPAAGPNAAIDTGNGAFAVDVDLDGDVDVFTKNGPWSNDGTGQFTPPVVGLGGLRVLASGDVEDDGDIDVILNLATVPTLFRNEFGAGGGGGFTATATFPVDGGTLRVGMFDVDADGDLDVAVPFQRSMFVLVSNGVVIHEQLGDGSFAAPVELATFDAVDRVGADDLDGDGFVDIVTVGERNTTTDVTVAPFGFVHAFRRTGSALAFETPRRFFSRTAGPLFDVDSDGDLDISGSSVVRGRRFSSPAQGRIRQFGSGTPGLGGAVPVLGAQGPARAGSTSYELRFRRAVGGAASVLLLGLSEAELPDFPALGLTLYVGGFPAAVSLNMGGTPGAAGQGDLTVPALSLPPPGTTFVLQTFHLDTSVPSFLTHSNGLAITYGS